MQVASALRSCRFRESRVRISIRAELHASGGDVRTRGRSRPPQEPSGEKPQKHSATAEEERHVEAFG